MKNAKRILPFLVCLVFVIGLMSSCGKDVNDKDISANSSETSSGVSVSSDDSAGDSADSSEDKNSGSAESKDSADKNYSGAESDKSGNEKGNDSDSKSSQNNSGSSDKNGVSDNITSSADKNGSSDSKSSSNNGGSASANNSGKDNSTGSNNGNTNNGSGNNGSGNSGNTNLTGDEKSFVITVYPKQAPLTCKNFEKLVNDGFYNGLTFYRVIKNFLAETGDPKNDGTGGSSEKIKGEFMSNGVDNRLSHKKGTVSMDRLPSDPNSASSKFFICYNDNCSFMDGNYAAFGKVTKGMNVVDDFLTVNREYGKDGSLSAPVTPITIKLAESIGKDSDGNPQYKFYVTY